MLPVTELMELLVACDNEHAIILLDERGMIVAWLGGAEKVFGYPANEVMGKTSSMLFTPEDIEKQMPTFELDVARTGRVAEDDRWMLRKDGARFWATGILVPLQGHDGDLKGFGKILRNRTDLKSQIETLESGLNFQSMANQQKNAFISTLAHEIRNPLHAMSTSLELLGQFGDQNESSTFARASIKRQIDFMQRLVDDLMEVTRINAGKVRLQLKETLLDELLGNAIETCRGSINERDQQLKYLIPDVPIVVAADANRLQQVFVNLIENAVKYTPRGGAIWIKAFVEAQAAVVKFEDTGIGIAPDLLPQIFKLFTQGESTESTNGRGLGIGLSVVKELVRLHGGTVQVRSDGLGRGSEFTVRLPLRGADANRPDNP